MKYCLLCEKIGHQTTECWSTHGLNTDRALELKRLCDAASAQPAEEVQPVAWMVFAGLLEKVPVYPPYRTREHAEILASTVKTKTEILPLYTSAPEEHSSAFAKLVDAAEDAVRVLQWYHDNSGGPLLDTLPTAIRKLKKALESDAAISAKETP